MMISGVVQQVRTVTMTTNDNDKNKRDDGV